MTAWAQIGHNDLRLFLREKSAFIWLLVMPLAFIYFMGQAVRAPGGPSVPKPAVVIDNHDRGFMGRLFLDALGEQGLHLVNPTHRDDARRGIVVPEDFTAHVLAKRGVDLEFFKVAGSEDQAAALVELRLLRALVTLNSLLIEHAVAAPGVAPDEAALRELRERQNPVALHATFAGRKPMPVGFNLSLPGNLVMYLMMNLLIFGGANVAAERRNGVLRRLLVQPPSKGSIVTGKVYGLMLLGLVQVGVLLGVGQFLLGVNIADQWLGILVTLLVFAWVAASLGVLVGSLIAAEEKVIGLCILASLTMAALGGCWWPLELVPGWLRVVAHLIPTGWAMTALHQLITFGGGLGEAARAIGVLALFGAAANLAAARWFRG
jgi:ABC-type multidrug transport system permease subunit